MIVRIQYPSQSPPPTWQASFEVSGLAHFDCEEEQDVGEPEQRQRAWYLHRQATFETAGRVILQPLF